MTIRSCKGVVERCCARSATTALCYGSDSLQFAAEIHLLPGGFVKTAVFGWEFVCLTFAVRDLEANILELPLRW